MFIIQEHLLLNISFDTLIIIIISIISISIRPLGQFGQEPEPSQRQVWLWYAASWASSLGQFAISFPCVQTFVLSLPGTSTSATTREIITAKGGTMGEKVCPVILPTWHLYSHHLLHLPKWRLFYMPQIYFPSEGRRAEGFFALKNPTACCDLYIFIQGVTGGTDQTSGGCSLC